MKLSTLNTLQDETNMFSRCQQVTKPKDVKRSEKQPSSQVPCVHLDGIRAAAVFVDMEDLAKLLLLQVAHVSLTENGYAKPASISSRPTATARSRARHALRMAKSPTKGRWVEYRR